VTQAQDSRVPEGRPQPRKVEALDKVETVDQAKAVDLIEAPDLDAEAIMQQIRARIRARRAEAKARGFDFEAYANGLYPVPPDAALSRDVHEAVRHMGLGYDKMNVQLALTETRLPLVGGAVQRLRAALHGLVLFYVNRLAARQIRFNEQTARALLALVRDLESEVRDLRARVSELEAEAR
jgi:hypothetical protein